ALEVFFFQAEDGIRYPLVTGVQTCALPIWVPAAEHVRQVPLRDVVAEELGVGPEHVRMFHPGIEPEMPRGEAPRGGRYVVTHARSEERRVGKGGSAGRGKTDDRRSEIAGDE